MIPVVYAFMFTLVMSFLFPVMPMMCLVAAMGTHCLLQGAIWFVQYSGVFKNVLPSLPID